jgi:2-polyprenyl-3-methyl-5-hydroxy-6-metoxy-1,4-benzoquinol methylase
MNKPDGDRGFPRWEEFYEEQAIESMARFNPELDNDLRTALDELGLRSGKALDLGTGPGTQAMQLARRGFEVTDISEAAIRLARAKAAEQGREIVWKQDDIGSGDHLPGDVKPSA